MTWSSAGFTWQADEKHARKHFAQLGISEGSRVADTPGTQFTARNPANAEDDVVDVSFFRSCAGVALYHSLDDPRVQFEVCMSLTGMCRPLVLHEARLMRVARYLLKTPAVVWKFDYQDGSCKLYGLADADHANDEETRRNMTNNHLYWGSNLLDHDVVRQQVVVISSGEAGFYSYTTCGASLLLVHGVLKAFGLGDMVLHNLPLVFTDSSAAKGTEGRTGVGGVKHLQTRFLWIQDAQRKAELQVKTVDTALNTADLGTKYLDKATRATLIAMMPLVQRGLGEMAAAALISTTQLGGASAGRSLKPEFLRETAARGLSFDILLAVALIAVGMLVRDFARGRQGEATAIQVEQVSIEFASVGTQTEAPGLAHLERVVLARLSAAEVQDLLSDLGLRRDSSRITRQYGLQVLQLVEPARLEAALRTRGWNTQWW